MEQGRLRDAREKADVYRLGFLPRWGSGTAVPRQRIVASGRHAKAVADEDGMSIELIARVESGHVFTRAEAEAVMEELLSGRAETLEIVRLLTALNQRPVCVAELAGFASVMRRFAAPVFAEGETRPLQMVDTCGTGGDGFDAFNVSTAAAIVAAAAGASVAKHGNRAASSRSGSADVLEALGVRIDAPLTRMGAAIRELGIGFLFAPAAHAATRHAVPARKQIGVRTVFNLLGPLTNPAGAQSQVLGVFSPDAIALVAATLVELEVERALVVHGAGGLDEISLAGETLVADVRHGEVRRYTVFARGFWRRAGATGSDSRRFSGGECANDSRDFRGRSRCSPGYCCSECRSGAGGFGCRREFPGRSTAGGCDDFIRRRGAEIGGAGGIHPSGPRVASGAAFHLRRELVHVHDSGRRSHDEWSGLCNRST